jgi:hypothetical protein
MHIPQKPLFILGAGCSVDYGYPTAAAMVPALTHFADGLGTEAMRVRAAVRRTVELMCQLKVETIDELAYRLHHGCGDGDILAPVDQARLGARRMDDAKIAVAALFHSLEETAAASGLKSYHTFFHRIFPSRSGGTYKDLLATSAARVLSFNYDRLFEIAFHQHFNVDPNYDFYYREGLNSGLNNVYNSKIEFADDRFSFIKLHGSVGIVAFDGNDGVRHQHSTPRADGAFDVKDSAFFSRSADGSISDRPQPPLIFFPHEKAKLLSERQGAQPYRVYAAKVWRQANVIAAQADEITLIGYSVCETDIDYVLRLLQAATSCTQIVIQNPNAEEICEKLATRAPDIRQKFVAFREPF